MTNTTTTPSPDLTELRPCLGIDVSKASLEVCLLRDSLARHRYRRSFPNTRCGLHALLEWLKAHHPEPVAAVMESTGSYGELAAHLLHEAGHRVSVVSALRIQQYALSRCRHNKTDQVDAEVIARFGLTQEELPQWLPTPEPQSQLRELLRRSDELAATLQAERNRLEAAGQRSVLSGSLHRHIRWLEKELARLEQAVNQLLKTHRDLAEDCERLESIPGIGAKTARVLVAELPRNLESSRTAAAWAGVAPRRFESGTIRKPSRIGAGGNRYLRKALFFPAIVARSHNPRFKTFADRLAERGLSKMAVVCAVLHKLLRTAFAVLKNKTIYDPSHKSVIHKTSQNPT
jgi:transposase